MLEKSALRELHIECLLPLLSLLDNRVDKSSKSRTAGAFSVFIIEELLFIAASSADRRKMWMRLRRGTHIRSATRKPEREELAERIMQLLSDIDEQVRRCIVLIFKRVHRH